MSADQFERTSREAFDGKLPRCEMRELDPPRCPPGQHRLGVDIGRCEVCAAPYVEVLGEQAAAMFASWSRVVAETVEQVRPTFEAVARTVCEARAVHPHMFAAPPLLAEPFARALEAKRRRGTGPAGPRLDGRRRSG